MEYPALRGRAILVAEDEVLIGMDIRTALEQAGAHVTTTTKVRHALVLVEHNGFAAAVMDHALAEGDSAAFPIPMASTSMPRPASSASPAPSPTIGRRNDEMRRRIAEHAGRLDVLIGQIDRRDT